MWCAWTFSAQPIQPQSDIPSRSIDSFRCCLKRQTRKCGMNFLPQGHDHENELILHMAQEAKDPRSQMGILRAHEHESYSIRWLPSLRNPVPQEIMKRARMAESNGCFERNDSEDSFTFVLPNCKWPREICYCGNARSYTRLCTSLCKCKPLTPDVFISK